MARAILKLLEVRGSGAYYDVCEHPEGEADAKRASQDKFLEVEEVLSVIITNILHHLPNPLYLAGGQKTCLDIGTD